MTRSVCIGLVAIAPIASCTTYAYTTRVAPESSEPGEPMQPAAGTVNPMSMRLADECPVALPGVRVALQATDEALALTFTSPTSELTQLRNRVQQLARLYAMCGWHRDQIAWYPTTSNAMQSSLSDLAPSGVDCTDVSHRSTDEPRSNMPPASIRVEDLPIGARIVFTPTNPTDVAGLRDRLAGDQRHMNGGECWYPVPR